MEAMLTLHATSKAQRTGTHICKAQHSSGQGERPSRQPAALAGSGNRTLALATSWSLPDFQEISICLLFSNFYYSYNILAKLYIGTLLRQFPKKKKTCESRDCSIKFEQPGC